MRKIKIAQNAIHPEKKQKTKISEEIDDLFDLPFFLSWASLALREWTRPSEEYPASRALCSPLQAIKSPVLLLFLIDSSSLCATIVTPNSFIQAFPLQVLELCPLWPQCEHFLADSFTISLSLSLDMHATAGILQFVIEREPKYKVLFCLAALRLYRRQGRVCGKGNFRCGFSSIHKEREREREICLSV